MKHPPDYKHLTWIGSIQGVHGIKGELRVKPFTDTPLYYQNEKELLLETQDGLEKVDIDGIHFHKNAWLIKIKGIDKLDQAENLKGVRLLIPDSRLRPLDNDEIFFHQLPGCQVTDQDGKDYGVLKGCFETGANLIYEVQYQGKEFMIPDAPGVVLELDLKSRRLVIDPLPGLFEDDEK